MTIHIEVWLYGPIARYGREDAGAYARLDMDLPAGSTLADLVRRLGIPAEERGITFINGSVAAFPGVEVDGEITLQNGDRVGLFHRRSMWPFQYRFGAAMRPELKEALRRREDGGIRHTYGRNPVPGPEGQTQPTKAIAGSTHLASATEKSGS